MIGWITLIAAPLPFFVCLLHFVGKVQELSELDVEVERVHAKVVYIEQIRKRENALLAPLKNPDPHYLDKYVETLHFLLPETKKLEAREQTAPRNHLLFSEEQIRANELFREVEEVQQQVIEVNEEDLKRLLCLIEGVTIWPYGPKEGRPLLIIKDFKLSKKEFPSKEKVFSLSMQLIKRESISK